jgi:hypothetical protein
MEEDQMNRGKISLLTCLAIVAIVALSFGTAIGEDVAKKDDVNVSLLDKVYKARNQVSPSERKAAAKNSAAKGLKVQKVTPAAAEDLSQPAPAPDADNAGQDQNKKQ